MNFPLVKNQISCIIKHMDYIGTQRIVQEVLDSYADGRYPVPVIEIATRLGIDVLSDMEYPSGKSGHIEIDDKENASIIVNENEISVRKRFTIAHEIAHFIFDMDYLKTHKCIDRNGDAGDATYRDREKRANYFAAHLLMPERAFVEQWLALRCADKISDYFGVSKEAAKFRAINLGLVSAQ